MTFHNTTIFEEGRELVTPSGEIEVRHVS